MVTTPARSPSAWASGSGSRLTSMWWREASLKVKPVSSGGASTFPRIKVINLNFYTFKHFYNQHSAREIMFHHFQISSSVWTRNAVLWHSTHHWKTLLITRGKVWTPLNMNAWSLPEWSMYADQRPVTTHNYTRLILSLYNCNCSIYNVGLELRNLL